MNYELENGYIKTVVFGCTTKRSIEYTGTVPMGYASLMDWSANACINAYYIDNNGNLAIDSDRLSDLRMETAQETIDYEPLVRKDLSVSEKLLESQYVKETTSGDVVVLENINALTPSIKITNLNNLTSKKIYVFTQGRNMLHSDFVSATRSGVTFTRNINGSLTVKGNATEDIQYTIAGSAENTTPLFTLKQGKDYYLNLIGTCELLYYDGQTTKQIYTGSSGLLNLGISADVTHVLLKIPSGTSVDYTIFPQLEYGDAFTEYEAHKCKMAEIDIDMQIVVPSDTLYPSNTLYPVNSAPPDYVLIVDNVAYLAMSGELRTLGVAKVGVYSDYNIIYGSKDTTIEVEYSTNIEIVREELQASIKVNADAITSEVTRALEAEYELSSKITQTATSITSEVTRSKDAEATLSSRITQTASSVVSEMNRAKDAEATLSSRITQTASEISLKVSRGNLSSELSMESGQVSLRSNRFVLDSTNCSISANGTITAKNVNLSGKITADSGKIGGFTITDKGIYSGKSSFNASSSLGVYIGTDGIAVGYNNAFRVDSSGNLTLGSLGELTIDGNINCTEYNGGIEYSGDLRIMLSTLYTQIRGNTACLGEYNGSIGFFGQTSGARRYNIAKLSTATSDISRVVTQFNKLLDALNAYNLLYVSGVF